MNTDIWTNTYKEKKTYITKTSAIFCFNKWKKRCQLHKNMNQYFQLDKCVDCKRIKWSHISYVKGSWPLLLPKEFLEVAHDESLWHQDWKNPLRLCCLLCAPQRSKAKRAWKMDTGLLHFCLKQSSLPLNKPWIWSPCLPWKINWRKIWITWKFMLFLCYISNFDAKKIPWDFIIGHWHFNYTFRSIFQEDIEGHIK